VWWDPQEMSIFQARENLKVCLDFMLDSFALSTMSQIPLRKPLKHAEMHCS
jgi:hypothetical protein